MLKSYDNQRIGLASVEELSVKVIYAVVIDQGSGYFVIAQQAPCNQSL